MVNNKYDRFLLHLVAAVCNWNNKFHLEYWQWFGYGNQMMCKLGTKVIFSLNCTKRNGLHTAALYYRAHSRPDRNTHVTVQIDEIVMD